MKRILITGAGSYVGTSVERYLQEYNSSQCRELYRIDTLSLKEDGALEYNFAPYDAVFHVAGIAMQIQAAYPRRPKSYITA